MSNRLMLFAVASKDPQYAGRLKVRFGGREVFGESSVPEAGSIATSQQRVWLSELYRCNWEGKQFKPAIIKTF